MNLPSSRSTPQHQQLRCVQLYCLLHTAQCTAVVAAAVASADWQHHA
jgi:hypothetical protein